MIHARRRQAGAPASPGRTPPAADARSSPSGVAFMSATRTCNRPASSRSNRTMSASPVKSHPSSETRNRGWNRMTVSPGSSSLAAAMTASLSGCAISWPRRGERLGGESARGVGLDPFLELGSCPRQERLDRLRRDVKLVEEPRTVRPLVQRQPQVTPTLVEPHELGNHRRRDARLLALAGRWIVLPRCGRGSVRRFGRDPPGGDGIGLAATSDTVVARCPPVRGPRAPRRSTPASYPRAAGRIATRSTSMTPVCERAIASAASEVAAAIRRNPAADDDHFWREQRDRAGQRHPEPASRAVDHVAWPRHRRRPRPAPRRPR